MIKGFFFLSHVMKFSTKHLLFKLYLWTRSFRVPNHLLSRLFVTLKKMPNSSLYSVKAN